MSFTRLNRTTSKILSNVSLAIFLLYGLFFVSGCSQEVKYTSLDLALLPCEVGINEPKFFQPLEFKKNGEFLYDEQNNRIEKTLKHGSRILDLVIFIHGWNKNPTSAEIDYQNFLCRFHTQLLNYRKEVKREGGLYVIGIFWPSTITNRPQEPLLVKPISYYQIRNRVDELAQNALADFFIKLRPIFENKNSQKDLRIHLIGHSFGGRMIIKSLQALDARGELVPFLTAALSTNVVLINAAVAPDRFDWIQQAIKRSYQNKSLARFTQDTSSYLFNIHSNNDRANSILFPIASIFNDDDMDCAAGACGVPSFPTLCVDETGKVILDNQSDDMGTSDEINPEINLWNVDTSRIVFDHSDIYKGRLAGLIADLLYGEEKSDLFFGLRRNLSQDASSRCD